MELDGVVNAVGEDALGVDPPVGKIEYDGVDACEGL